MKELKPKIRGINNKRRRAVACPQTSPLNQCLPMPGNKPIRGVTTAIATLQPQRVEEDDLQQSTTGWERLTAKARQINQLAAQLEQAMFEFKAIANEVNRERRITQVTKKSIKSVCEYLTLSVPCIKHRKSGGFVLTTRLVDLFRAEREASQVAQALRRRAKRKRVVSLISWRNPPGVQG